MDLYVKLLRHPFVKVYSNWGRAVQGKNRKPSEKPEKTNFLAKTSLLNFKGNVIKKMETH